MNSAVLIFITFGFIKLFLGVKTFLQVIPLIIGGYELVVKRKFILRKEIIVLSICLFLFGVFFPYVFSDSSNLNFLSHSLARFIQIFLLMAFAIFVALRINRSALVKVFIFVTLLSVIIFIAQLLFEPSLLERNWLGYNQRGLITGEPNYSGLFYFSLFLLSYFFKEKVFSFTFIILGVLTYSRLFYVLMIFFFTIVIIEKFVKKILPIAYLFYFVFLSSPLIVYLLTHCLEKSALKSLKTVTSGRFFIQDIYLKIFVSDWSGVGVKNGLQNYLNKKDALSHYAIQSYGKDYTKIYASEQHSTYLQALTEFGIFGYLLMGFFGFYLLRQVGRINPENVKYLLVLFLSGVFLNTLFESYLYVAICFFSVPYLNELGFNKYSKKLT